MIRHFPVMVREVAELLAVKPDGIYVDATVGLGGHASEILKLLNSGGRLVAIDRDASALQLSEKNLADSRAVFLKGGFSQLKDLLINSGIKEADGVLFDFGVSMMQLKDMARGFSFSSDDFLDMRMDRGQQLTAEDIVNTYSEKELERIIREYGDERFSGRIARAIVSCRIKSGIKTGTELARIVCGVYKRKSVKGPHHPATRTFQALRIAVNDEINEIHRGLEAAVGVLRPGGRLCTISYHSLEDRAVKNFFKDAAKEGLLKILTKKPLIPSHDETRLNPSARSAKLRGAEKS